MALTSITITATETAPSGGEATGTITATLSEQIQNATTTIEPEPILGELVGGKLLNQAHKAFTLYANDDAATSPAGTYYSFVVQVAGAPVREFTAIIKHTAAEGKVDITELETPI
jgi:hypothetical protein